MEKPITIIYANRNRDLERIETSLKSLAKQEHQNFKVIFVDYGSRLKLVSGLKNLIEKYDFVEFFFLKTAPLLWNKSKALNFGLTKVESRYVFIADVDLIFHPLSTKLFESVANPEKYFLFKMAYLDEAESKRLASSFDFEKLKVRNYGHVNGMILAGTKAFMEVGGYDEFFHFYGAEDEDLFTRMENKGYYALKNTETYFFHNWHKTYPASEENVLSKNPRVQNIRRINQYHFLQNKKNGITKPERQQDIGKQISEDDFNTLQSPTKVYRIPNILAYVEHFLNEDLKSFKDEVVTVEFYEDPYFLSLKYKVKKFLGKQTQPYCTLKEVNDMLLKKIVFEFRDYPYSFEVAYDLKSIHFTIKL